MRTGMTLELKHPYKLALILRRSEGTARGWERVAEIDDFIKIKITKSGRVRYIRKSEYEQVDCYPTHLHVFSPDGLIDVPDEHMSGEAV